MLWNCYVNDNISIFLKNEHCIEKYSIELQNLSKKYTDLQQLSTAIVHLKIILIDHLLKKKVSFLRVWENFCFCMFKYFFYKGHLR